MNDDGERHVYSAESREAIFEALIANAGPVRGVVALSTSSPVSIYGREISRCGSQAKEIMTTESRKRRLQILNKRDTR